MATLLDTRHKSNPGALAQLESALSPQWRGRGARSNEAGRFEGYQHSYVDDGWDNLAEAVKLRTTVYEDRSRSIISHNSSPDIPFDQSINPYRGCEHGCIYCYARPTHAYMGLSPGLDFESKLFFKPNAAALLREELSAPTYKPRTIALGANTDPYQPIERTYRLSRQILEVLSDFNHPVGVITKSALILRDLDLLRSLAERQLVRVAVSVTTLDAKLARQMEPRAATPAKRLEALATLSAAGVPTTVLIGPIIPGLNDVETESILKAAAAVGVKNAGYTTLRLPLEIKDLFQEWLTTEMPDRAAKVISLMRSMRQGKLYDADFATRMAGTGPYAWMIGRRFQLACEKLGLNKHQFNLRTDLFARPPRAGDQLALF